MQLNQHTITILQQQYYDVAGNHVGTNDLPALRCFNQNITIIFISSIAYSTKVNLTTQKMKFLVSIKLSISSVNVIKSAGNCIFGRIYRRNPKWIASIFV